jgi:DNA-binding NarL/FixJ family response regulator
LLWYQRITIGIRVTKAIAKCVLYIIVTALLSINNNNYDYTERERKVIELYNQGKSTRDLAKDLRMSLRDISIILKKDGVSHGIAIIDNVDDNNKKSHFNNAKAT